jgi:hypothetical protein
VDTRGWAPCGWHLAGFDEEFSILNFVGILEQSARRRPGSARTILVVNASVTRTHKEVRLRKPMHWTSQVRTVNGEHLKILSIDIANPAGNIAGFPIPGINHGIAVGGEPGLADRKLFQRAESEP